MMLSTLDLVFVFIGLLFFLFGLFKLFKLLKSEHEFVENYLYTYSSLALSVVIISYVLGQIIFSIALLMLVFLFAVTYVSSHNRLPLKGPVFNIGYRELLGSGFMGMISFIVMLWGLFFMMAYGISIYAGVSNSILTSLVVSMLIGIVIGASVYMLYGNRYYADLKRTTEIRKDIGEIVSNNPTTITTGAAGTLVSSSAKGSVSVRSKTQRSVRVTRAKVRKKSTTKKGGRRKKPKLSTSKSKRKTTKRSSKRTSAKTPRRKRSRR